MHPGLANWRLRSKAIFFLLLLNGLAGVGPAFAQTSEEAFYNQWVEYQNGEVSIKFDETPVDLAIEAIRVRTGFHIVMPPATQRKLLNLRLNKLALEPAMRSLLSVIGFQNFALVYDQEGRPNRALIVGAGSEQRPAADATKPPEGAGQDLTAEEKDRILKQLERWSELGREERGRVEDRLKTLPPSENREQLVKEYGRQLLEIKK